MNEKIIAELNEIIEIKKSGAIEYKIDFTDEIASFKRIIFFVKSKKYAFLSVREAMECALRA